MPFMTRIAGAAALAAVGATFLSVGVCSAEPITYNVDQTIGSGSVIGTIQTDGATGVLGPGDITAWNLELNGVGASYNLTSSSSSVFMAGSDVVATVTELYFDFSGTDGGYFLFQRVPFSGSHYYCDQALGTGPCIQGASVIPQYYTDPSAQIAPEIGNQIIGTTSIPEPSALALLGSAFIGLFLITRRSDPGCVFDKNDPDTGSA